MDTKICLAGATGHVGRELVKAILASGDLTLTAAVGYKSAGQRLAAVIGEPRADIPVHCSVADALKAGHCDVLIDYTRPDTVKENVRAAIAAGCNAVIGTSGLTDADYTDIESWAMEKGVGVFAAGNFSVTAALLQYFAVELAPRLPHWEILDYASDTKPDAPSGTARELAYQLARVGKPGWAVPVSATQGMQEARGATLNGSQMHSIRVPGFYSGVEVIFGGAGERLELRHESNSYAPYVTGTLLAARKVREYTGLKRGMGFLLGLTSQA